ncbi:MAG: RIP metalloprotease RseP [Elusimicrobia bacterium]|nr:RIP metalloprotease RseP [Elusimicrobiota bacterium]
MLSGLVADRLLAVGAVALTFGLVISLHELGHFLMAKRLGVRVEQFAFGFGPELAGFTWRKTRYSLCLVPFGGLVRLAGELPDRGPGAPDEFFAQSWYRRIAIALAGPGINYVLAFLLFTGVLWVWGTSRPSSQPIIGEVVPSLPAAQAHLQAKDRVVSINGQPMTTWEEMAQFIHTRPGQSLALIIRRDGQEFTRTLFPQVDPQRKIGLIGVVPLMETHRLSLWAAGEEGARDLVRWTMLPLHYLAEKVKRREAPKELAGPVGIAQMISSAAKAGIAPLLYLIAVISTGVGLFNVFPIPMLDGGHVLLYLWEGVSRRRLTQRVVQVSNAIGIPLLALIFVYALFQDLERWRHGFWR